MISVRLFRSNPPLSCSYLLHGPEQVPVVKEKEKGKSAARRESEGAGVPAG
jgi:hypothetical protein